MTTLAALLINMGRAGATIRDAGGGAGIMRGSALSPDRMSGVKARKRALLALLLGYHPADGDAEYVYGERLGVADGLGLATHPGSAAWMVAVGESMLASKPGEAPRGDALITLIARVRRAWADAGLGGLRVAGAGLLPRPASDTFRAPGWQRGAVIGNPMRLCCYLETSAVGCVDGRAAGITAKSDPGESRDSLRDRGTGRRPPVGGVEAAERFDGDGGSVGEAGRCLGLGRGA